MPRGKLGEVGNDLQFNCLGQNSLKFTSFDSTYPHSPGGVNSQGSKFQVPYKKSKP